MRGAQNGCTARDCATPSRFVRHSYASPLATYVVGRTVCRARGAGQGLCVFAEQPVASQLQASASRAYAATAEDVAWPDSFDVQCAILAEAPPEHTAVIAQEVTKKLAS